MAGFSPYIFIRISFQLGRFEWKYRIGIQSEMLFIRKAIVYVRIKVRPKMFAGC